MKRTIPNSLMEFLRAINRSVVTTLVLVAAVFATPPMSFADTIFFSNFAASNGYNVMSGNFIGNDFSGDVAAEGDTFTPTVNTFFTSLDIALGCFGAGSCPDDFTVSLDQNNGGVPGAVVESFTVKSSSLDLFGNNNTPLVLTSVSDPLLTARTPYWITVSSDPNDTIIWNWNSTTDTSSEVLSPDAGTDWYALGFTPGAYQVAGDPAPVPEPSTFVLLLTALPLIGLGYRRVRNRVHGKRSADEQQNG